MATASFPVEYSLNGLNLADDLKEKVEKRLSKLSNGHKDITGASVFIKKLTSNRSMQVFETRLVLYFRPDNIAVAEKADSTSAALLQTLDTMERQVRKRREMLRERWKRAS